MWGGIGGVVIQACAGGVCANIAGELLRKYDLGAVGNSLFISRLYPTTSAAKMAASLRWTGLLSMGPLRRPTQTMPERIVSSFAFG
jgi:hypothetical protein